MVWMNFKFDKKSHKDENSSLSFEILIFDINRRKSVFNEFKRERKILDIQGCI